MISGVKLVRLLIVSTIILLVVVNIRASTLSIVASEALYQQEPIIEERREVPLKVHAETRLKTQPESPLKTRADVPLKKTPLSQSLPPETQPAVATHQPSQERLRRKFEPFPQNSTCPLAFGLGHQKSGTTAIVFALGVVANATARNDVYQFWFDRATLPDSEVFRLLNRETYGYIQKEGYGIRYARSIVRVCPETRFYYVQRGMLQTVRSVADRLRLKFNTSCTRLSHIPEAWQGLFQVSNDTSCLVRVAKHYLQYQCRFKEFEKTLDYAVPVIDYESFVENRSESILQLCRSLELTCHGKIIGETIYQTQGKNRNKTLSEIWPPYVLKELEQLQAACLC
jgi:hypothetical protein